MKSFNINMPVMFKPTEYGKQVYRDKKLEIQKHIDERCGVRKVKLDLEVDENWWCKMQMHSFMNYFGDAMYLGGTPVILGCEIRFYYEDLTDIYNLKPLS